METYDIKIYDRVKDLMNAGKKIDEFDNNDLCKIFEYYSALRLNNEYGTQFLLYEDIEPDFKELNKMSKNDTGIDLCNLIDTIVQCKLRKGQLTWKECSTFFGSQNMFCESEKKTIVRWSNLIITRNSESILSNNLIERRQLFIDKLYERNSIINYCQQLIQNPPEYPLCNEEVILRDYQSEAIELIKNNGNVIICLPTGTGKNIVIINSLERNMKYLILVPRRILMDQLKEEIIKQKPSFKTKLQTIGDGNNKYNETKLITICVYNSIDVVLNFCSSFNKIFIDEAHNISIPEIYKLDNDEYEESIEDDEISDYSENFSLDSSDEIEQNKMENESEDEILNKSYVKKIRELRKYNNNVYLSATIDEEEGFVFYKKDIREMINKGYLSDYDIRIPIFSDKAIDRNICEYLIKNYRSIIIYCNRQKEGKKINMILNDILPNSSLYIDCKTKKTERNKIIKKYSNGDIPFLVNVRTLIEGFNAPITNGVCFMHMPKSKTKLIQVIGRALRLHPLKTIAHVILPYSNEEDKEEINYFLKVMSRNDSRIYKSYCKKELGGYICFEDIYMNEEDDEERNEIELKYEKIYNSFGILLNGDELFMKRYNELKEWVDVNGMLPSYKAKNTIEKSLHKWSSHRREDKKNNNLSEYKIKLLEQIRGWYWDKFSEDFMKKYEKLKIFVKENNRLPIKGEYLYRWCMSRRTEKREGSLSEDRIKLLEKIENWWWEKDIESIWMEKYNRVIAFVEINNKLPSSGDLGWWCYKERTKKEQYNLSEYNYRKELLEKLPQWHWGIDDIWIKEYHKLKEFIEINGRFPINNIENENSLAKWVCRRRSEKRLKQLTDDKIKLLEEIHGWNWGSNKIVKKEDFNIIYKQLIEYIKINDGKIPKRDSDIEEEKKLGKWIDYRRRDKRIGNLSMTKEKIDALEKIEGWEWGSDKISKREDFNDRFKQLIDFIEKEERFPKNNIKNEKSLAKWVCRIRNKKNNLTEDKIKLLEEIPDWYWK
jgi:superfamily II DNA or RNA helicase